MRSCTRACSAGRNMVVPKNTHFPYKMCTSAPWDHPMWPTSGFKWPLGSKCPSIPSCPVLSWGRWSPFWAIKWSLMPIFGPEFTFLAPTCHLHTSCCPKLGQHLVASASSVPNSRPLPLRFLSLPTYRPSAHLFVDMCPSIDEAIYLSVVPIVKCLQYVMGGGWELYNTRYYVTASAVTAPAVVRSDLKLVYSMT